MTVEEAFEAQAALSLHPTRLRRLRRRLRLALAKAGRLLRANSMLPFTAAVLVGAALVGGGVFDKDAGRPQRASSRAAPAEVAAPISRPSILQPFMTIYLVDSEVGRLGVEQDDWETATRDFTRNEERLAFTVRNLEEEERVTALIAEIRANAPGVIVRVEDLRWGPPPRQAAPERVVIFMLVDSEEKLGVSGWDESEDESRAVRQFIKRVPMLARSVEEEGVAWEAIEDARLWSGDTRIVVEDFRTRR